MLGACRVFLSAVLAFALLLVAPAASALVTVGPGCKFAHIQDAINYVLDKERRATPDIDPFISVVSGPVYKEALDLDGSNIGSYSVFGTPYDHPFVQIYGDYAACTNEDHVSTAQISAADSSGSVLFIHGNRRVEVALNHLTLTGAHNSVGLAHGGGIDFDGTGVLDLANVNITNNFASGFNFLTNEVFGAGGGIYVNGTGSGITVNMHGQNTIESNTAALFGGGISISGATQFNVADAAGNTTIAFNSAGTVGGGIVMFGGSSLNLVNTTISTNNAVDGGGLWVDGPLNVFFGDSVSVNFNTASGSGGGILIQNGTVLDARSSASQTIVFGNKAAIYGGGVYVNREGSMLSTAFIGFNSAFVGGGVAVRAETDGDRDVTALFAMKAANPFAPAVIFGNDASGRGGGVYVKPSVHLAGIGGHGFNTGFGQFCAADFQINNNTAPEGAAIYEDTDSDGFFDDLGGDVGLNGGCSQAGPICATGVACNEISHNSAEQADGTPTRGATIFLDRGSHLAMRRARFQDNDGGHVIRSINDPARALGGIVAKTVLMTDNTLTGELINDDQLPLTITNSTLAHNAIGAVHVIRAGGPISIGETIIAENIGQSIDFAGNGNTSNRHFDYVLTNPLDETIPQGSTNLFAPPLFVAPANRDYHLMPNSPAIDVAPASTGELSDFDLAPRNVDLPQIGNVDGPLDLGAYELQSIPACAAPDTLFCNGFD